MSNIKEGFKSIFNDPNASPVFKLIVAIMLSFISAISILFMSFLSSKNQSIDFLKDQLVLSHVENTELKKIQVLNDKKCDEEINKLYFQLLQRTDNSTTELLDQLGVGKGRKTLTITPNPK